MLRQLPDPLSLLPPALSRGLLPLCLLCLCGLGALAQDIHYVQFQNAPLYQSPGLTAVMPADYRVSAIYRSQWSWVPVDYQTFGLSFDTKVAESRYGFLGLGLMLNRDQAGDSGLSMTSVMGALAYTLKISGHSLATLGFDAGMGQRSLGFLNLTFDNQFNGDQFVPGSSTGEQFGSETGQYFDMGTGLNYRFQQSRRTNFDLGLSLRHINRPNLSFADGGEVPLPRRWSAYAAGGIQVDKFSDVLFRSVWHRQQDYGQILMGMGWRYHLSLKSGGERWFAFHSLYRFGDALIPMMELGWPHWRLALSYDINLSAFRAATDQRGGPELSATYLMKRPERKPDYRKCPVL